MTCNLKILYKGNMRHQRRSIIGLEYEFVGVIESGVRMRTETGARDCKTHTIRRTFLKRSLENGSQAQMTTDCTDIAISRSDLHVDGEAAFSTAAQVLLPEVLLGDGINAIGTR